MIEFSRVMCMLVVIQWVGRGRDGIDTLKECLRETFGCQARMVQDMSEWQRFVREYAWGVGRRMNL